MPSWRWAATGPPGARPLQLRPRTNGACPTVELPGPDEPVGFETAHQAAVPRARPQSMRFAFDLWSYDDVASKRQAILDRLDKGTMPCDGAWPGEGSTAFERWLRVGWHPEREPARRSRVGALDDLPCLSSDQPFPGRGGSGGRAAGHRARALLRPRVRVRDHAGDRVPVPRAGLDAARRGARDPHGAVVRVDGLRVARQHGRDGRGCDPGRAARRDGAAARRSLAVPHAFGDDALVFGLAYFAVRALHLVAYAVVARGRPAASRRAVLRLSRGRSCRPRASSCSPASSRRAGRGPSAGSPRWPSTTAGSSSPASVTGRSSRRISPSATG